MKPHSHHMFLRVALLAFASGCIDFTEEKIRYCQRNTTKCDSRTDGGPGDVGSAPGNVWMPTDDMKWDRSSHTATLLPNGSVLVVGGYSNALILSRVEVYDPLSAAWSELGYMASARRYHTATLLPGDTAKVLVTGGSNNSDSLSTTEIYDSNTSSWSNASPMGTARAFHTSTMLSNNKILVTGGINGDAVLATSEVYNPTANTWSRTGSMGTPRAVHTETQLKDGRVLVTGGLIEQAADDKTSRATAAAEVYDPKSAMWHGSGSMSLPRYGHTATLLSDGRVLITGGRRSNDSASTEMVEIYDPESGQWSRRGSMAFSRAFHRATLLPEGKVLISGGRVSDAGRFVLTAEAEVYDPASDTWKSAGTMGSSRESHTTTLLPDGKVLVTGGLFYSNVSKFVPQNKVELYTP